MTSRAVVTLLVSATFLLGAFGGMLLVFLPVIAIALLTMGIVAAAGVLAWT